MTYAPQDLLDAIRYLHGQGAPSDALGIVGDASHAATGGYHEGRDDLAAHGRLGYDYSTTESPRDTRPTDAASALDFAATSWWRPLTLWLVDQCRAGAPGTEDIREIIYTPDGQVIKRWDRIGIRDSGDDSHLWHTHISFHRDSEGRRRSFLDLLHRYFEPGRPAGPIDTGDDEQMTTGQIPAGFAFGGPTGRQDFFVAGGGCGPVNGGQFNNKRVVLGLGADFTPTAGVKLRVATKADGKAWTVQTVTIKAGDDRYPIFLPDGTTKFTIGRVQRDTGDQDVIAKPDGTTSVTADAALCPVWWDLEFEKR